MLIRIDRLAAAFRRGIDSPVVVGGSETYSSHSRDVPGDLVSLRNRGKLNQR